MSSGTPSDQSVSKVTEQDVKTQPPLADCYVMKRGLLKKNFKTFMTFNQPQYQYQQHLRRHSEL